MKYTVLLLLLSLQVFAVDVHKKEGVLLFEYGDGLNGEYITRYHLQTDSGKLALDLSDVFMKKAPIHNWLGKRVEIQSLAEIKVSGLQRVNAIKLMESVAGTGVSGSQPWVTILCKFSDVAAEPENLNFFSEMYNNQPAGLDHYWREVSHSNIDVVGSMAVDWVDLPSSQGTYMPTPGSGSDADLDSLFADCTAAADPHVDFSNTGNGQPYVGINMMFNEDLDCCAWGGGKWASLDGTTKVWRTTWNPPWSFANEGVIAHEMGHGFGLPHANNSDDDGNPYDSPWDVMSAATGYGVNDNIYGRLGKHINAYFKRQLGWVDDSEGWITNNNSFGTVTLDHTSIASTNNKRFIYIPVSDGTHYVVESRKKIGNYEANLPGTAVIIHHVDTSREEPPWVVDGDSPAADYADTEGVMWKVGETFVDPIDGVEVEVLSQTAQGFRVQVRAGDDLIFADGFDF
ncbi:hypothetical protein [Marinicella rhabdoformis]|uniref:hypothetical protein n=1 Tax=Marinicella rhabdoformis TaxID=2580566 RepID=UPI0012AEC8D4|nr:hypothetical protein [Marinicella rhabdoformis]